MANEVNALNTRGQLATAIGDFIQDTSTARHSMILVDLDRAYRDALRRFQWPQLFRWVDATVSVNTGGAYFFVPKDVGRIVGVVNINTPYLVPEMALPDFIDQTAGFTNLSGLPWAIAHAGDSAINQVLQPATALEILSDGTDVRTGYVKGTLSGESKTVTFTLTSAVAVSLGTWDEVYEVALSAVDTARSVTIRLVSSTTVGTIVPRETRSTYHRYRLAAIPQVQTSFRVIYKLAPPMVMDEAHEYLVPLQDYLFEVAVADSFESRRQWVPAQQHRMNAERLLMTIWEESRGRRQEQYVPASPYDYFGGSGIYVGALGVGGIY